MAFNVDELSLMAYTGANGGHHLYWFSNTDADDVTAVGYFDDAEGQLKEGDVILDVNGAIFYIVDDITDGAVTVVAMHDAPA